MTTTDQASSISVPISIGENYDFWSVKMNTFFSLLRFLGHYRRGIHYSIRHLH